MNSEIPLPTSEFSTPRFKSNELFNKQRNNFDDGAFFRTGKYKMKYNNQRMNSDGFNAFLSGSDNDGLGSNAIEKIFSEELVFSDLASLTQTDLELMGFKYDHERESLLQYFSELPNQDPTFEELILQPEAQEYNSLILKNGTGQLNNMQHALVGANYKLQYNVPDDVLVGDKYFASRFVVEALDELNDATDEIKNEIEDLHKVIDSKKRKNKVLSRINWILLAAASAIVAFWYFKSHQ